MRVNWLAWGIAACLLIDGGIIAGWIGRNPPMMDFDVFYRASGLAHPYPGASETPFVNPPTSLWLFWPLSWMSRGVAAAVWTLTNVGLFWVGMRRLFGDRAVALAFISPLLFWALWLGQSTPMLAGIVGVAFAAPAIPGGILLGIAASVKPQFLWLAPLIFWRSGEVKRGVAMVITLGILAMVAWSALGEWITALPAFKATMLRQGVMTQSASIGGLMALIDPSLVPIGMLLGFGLAVVAKPASKPELLACVVGGSVLAAPYALPHDLVALVPMAWLAMEGRGRALALSFLVGLLPVLSVAAGLFEMRRRPARQRSSVAPRST